MLILKLANNLQYALHHLVGYSDMSTAELQRFRQLQDRAVGLFRDSLARKGFLGLGSKESLRFSAHADAFAPFVPEEKIYQRRDA